MGLFDRRPRSRGIDLPTFRAPATTTRVLERVQYPLGGSESGGQVIINGPGVPTEESWLIEHAYVTCNSSKPTALVMYAGFIALQNVLDASSSGNGDTGEWPTGLLIPGGSQLVAVWTNVSTGAAALMNLQLTRLTTGVA